MAEQNNTRFFGMLGFAMRAGKVEVGTDAVLTLVAKGLISLVIIASDASDKSKERIKKICEFYNTDCIEPGVDAETLSQRLGKISNTVCVAIKDEGFKNEILKALKG